MSEEDQIWASVRQMLILCEETGLFEFNSRHFFDVGEWEIAFSGIYRFAKGNKEFLESLEPQFSNAVKYLAENSDFDEARVKPSSPWVQN